MRDRKITSEPVNGVPNNGPMHKTIVDHRQCPEAHASCKHLFQKFPRVDPCAPCAEIYIQSILLPGYDGVWPPIIVCVPSQYLGAGLLENCPPRLKSRRQKRIVI